MNVERVEQFSSVRWWQALNPAVYLVSILPGVAVWLLAEWQQDAELIAAIHALPRVLEEAAHQDWSALGAELGGHRSLYCLGRGPALAISNEAALKFKETCQLHAESYSSAEVLHGPVSIVDRGFPVIALCAADAAEASLASVADALAAHVTASFCAIAERGTRLFA